MTPLGLKIKYLTERQHLIPVFRPMKEMGEHYTEALPDSIEVSEIIKELVDDFKKVLTNGGIRRYMDHGYYDNYNAVDESRDIGRKWSIIK